MATTQQAVLADAGDGERHGGMADGLAEPHARINADQRAVIGDDAQLAVGLDDARPHPFEIERHQPDTMGIMARQIGQHQIVGNEPRLPSLAADAAKDGRDRMAERLGPRGNIRGHAPAPPRPAPARRCERRLCSARALASAAMGWEAWGGLARYLGRWFGEELGEGPGGVLREVLGALLGEVRSAGYRKRPSLSWPGLSP